MLLYILSLNFSFMLKTHLNMRSSPELCDLQRFFLSEIDIPEQRMTPVELPFYNFVCYAADMLSRFSKSTLDVTFNVFLVDQHLRQYSNSIELYRRFVGFINSWKKYGDSDEGRLLTTFLLRSRNERRNVRLFLRLRKILLKNINQKILQEIKLNHEDAVTIVHTLDMISGEQRKQLTKKINDHFIAKNVKHPNCAILNAAVLCEYLLSEINDKGAEHEKFNSNLSNKITKLLKSKLDFIEEFSEDGIEKKEASLFKEETANQLLTQQEMDELEELCKENSSPSQAEGMKSSKSLVSLEKCLKELSILKEKDLEIDNRFKKIKEGA